MAEASIFSFDRGNKPVKESLQEYARGIAGGLLFSFPLLYTMEVWWAGYMAQPYHLISIIVATFMLLLGYNRYAGMRPGTSWRDIIIDSVEEMGIGFLLSLAALLMLNRIQIGVMGIDEILGKVVIEAMAVSIGVSIGTAQLGTGEGEENPAKEQQEEENAKGAQGEKASATNKKALAVLALCGSIIIGGNIAPTEEVLMLAVEARPIHILLMSLASIVLCILVVYFSNFKGTQRHQGNNMLYEIVFDTCVSYLLALIASAFCLWYFGRFENMSLWNIISQCVVLGVVASLGASAGRLLIK